jgi:Na+-transporting NADH:ubiquinone oxidoreductase subunit D
MAKGKVKRLFLDNVGSKNPVFMQILGICSTLAVTNSVKNTVVMSLGLIFTTAFSALFVSLLRKSMPARVRMMVETLIIAAFVIIVDIVLRAFVPDISRQLGPYVGLIITNCIIMGRMEAFALNNPPGISFMDGIASGFGYAYVLLIVAVFRELLGAGTIWGLTVFGDWWTNWAIMIMPPGAFFMLAIFIWVVKGVFIKSDEETK